MNEAEIRNQFSLAFQEYIQQELDGSNFVRKNFEKLVEIYVKENDEKEDFTITRSEIFEALVAIGITSAKEKSFRLPCCSKWPTYPLCNKKC